MSKIKTKTFETIVANVDNYISDILNDNQSYSLKDIKMVYGEYSRVIVIVILEKE